MVHQETECLFSRHRSFFPTIVAKESHSRFLSVCTLLTLPVTDTISKLLRKVLGFLASDSGYLSVTATTYPFSSYFLLFKIFCAPFSFPPFLHCLSTHSSSSCSYNVFSSLLCRSLSLVYSFLSLFSKSFLVHQCVSLSRASFAVRSEIERGVRHGVEVRKRFHLLASSSTACQPAEFLSSNINIDASHFPVAALKTCVFQFIVTMSMIISLSSTGATVGGAAVTGLFFLSLSSLFTKCASMQIIFHCC